MAVIHTARSLTDSVLVGLSGGKDSLVTLDLCAKHFRRVEAYFLYTVPGLRFEETTLRYCERRYSLTVHRLPHWNLSHQLREWAFRGPPPGDVPRLKLLDVESEARRLAGVAWIATGQRKDDSLERRAMLSHCGGVDLRNRRFYPLSEWSARMTYTYLKREAIPLPADYALFGHSWGGRLYADDLVKIRRAFPDDYQRITRYFPQVEAQVAQAVFRGSAWAEQPPDVHDEASEPIEPQGGAV